MSDEPKANTAAATAAAQDPSLKFPPINVCRDVWNANRTLGFREIAKILQGMGYHCNFTWLSRQKDKDPQWRDQWELYRSHDVSPERIISALTLAEKDGKQVNATHLLGVKARLAARLWEVVKDLPIPTVVEYNMLLDCMPKLDALIHNHRGHDVQDGKGSGSVSPSGKGSVIPISSAPRPQIDPIKPPAAAKNGSANGSAH